LIGAYIEYRKWRESRENMSILLPIGVALFILPLLLLALYARRVEKRQGKHIA
jgi:hypothetical protein